MDRLRGLEVAGSSPKNDAGDASSIHCPKTLTPTLKGRDRHYIIDVGNQLAAKERCMHHRYFAPTTHSVKLGYQPNRT